MATSAQPGPGDGTAAETAERSRIPADLAERLGDLARYLEARADVSATLQGIVDTAVDTVPGAAYAGISVIARRRVMDTPIVSAALVAEVDRAQIEFEQGPCLDALYERHTVALPDTAGEVRWPRFAARAAELGIGSMLSFQLYVLGDDLGALNLYARVPRAFDADSERVGRLFAAHAGVATATAQQVSQLRHAIDTRDLIGQAKGILMERYKLTAEQAFALLVRASQHSNTKLTEIASYLCRSGELPTGR
ncbi:GAF and ANTAR domain-containing protein [Nocardia rhamnosiphila]|uniref:GAF and ANTAR domain-containing protein n=1 Tax=Nocardia rhamnosiphila TaxID=426716 RepID=A0ABV2WIA5_9NOCA